MDLYGLYNGRIDRLQKEIAVLKQKKRRYGLGRLVSFMAAIILFFALLEVNGVMAATIAILLLLLFLFIAVKDMDNTRHLKFRSILLKINEEELGSLDHHFNDFEDGSAFLPENHPYAYDLDIFGKHSLFQFINRTTATPSAALLADRLLHPSSKNKIGQLQQGIKALQPEIDWRQRLQALGRRSKITGSVYRQIAQWSTSRDHKPNGESTFKWMAIVLPLITLLFIILASFGILPWKILWLSFCAHLLLLWRIDKVVTPAYEYLSEAINTMDAFYDSLECMVDKAFTDPYLQSLQQQCFHDGIPAHQLLSRLKKILHRLNMRLNPLVHFPLNLAIFWDWHQYRRLQSWQSRYREGLIGWVNAYAEMEVLSSFANMAFNHPGWCFPEIADQHFTFSALSLGHPLLAEGKRICNDAGLSGAGKILLITGSNMAGKSTFLRTVGVNMVLAMAGSPVCARKMEVSETEVISSMRIADNLEENISTFYAELKKLETILQRVRAHEKVFLLLDEILRGTNSLDRHAGARALIRQFLAEKAVGILATHDLELTEMANECKGQILNYHFDVQVQEEELYFDYKLKPGICTSMNASLLMRKIGIDV
jgi:hypothetical protein